jgi:hypothetical protein
MFCLLTVTAVHAQTLQQSPAVPRVIRVTGVFVPATGQPAGPVETLTLAIYADEKGGTPLWQETQTIAVDATGRYTVLLGASAIDGLPMNLFASGDARWLGRRFERPGETEQARVLLASVPYALKASDAETLGGHPASAYVLAPTASAAVAATEKGGTSLGTAVGLAVAPGTPNVLAKYLSDGVTLGNSAVMDTGGAVGINSPPFDYLSVTYTNTNGQFTGYAVQNLGNTTTSYSGMLFYDQNGALGQFQGFNNVTHEYRINNIAPGGSINFMLGSSPKFTVASNGFIGIGTASPAVPLDVVGTAPMPNGISSYFVGGNTVLNVSAGGTWATSLRTSSGILAGDGVMSLSDARAKTIQGRSDGAADLNTLLGIEVTDFVFKDVVEKGNRPQKKVIAQQVEKVYPLAVRKTTDVVPDIYQKAPVKDGWIELATALKIGDRVRLITEGGQRGVYDVVEVKPDKFRTAFVEDVPQVFVYGREVKDVRVVDYDAISMLNVSATQELNQIITQQETELRALRARLEALEQILKEQLAQQK